MESPLVKVKQGQLEGDVRTNLDGRKFLSFLGIPYAKPPVGELRFKAPLPGDPWTGIRDATQEGTQCYSRNDFTGKCEGSEDCLYLNVFTRNLPQSGQKLKPVMVWIHGGGFVSGSGSPAYFGPEFLLLEDIVLVTFNYRLGVVGFLSLEDPSLEIPGNAGMKDQVLTLKWVQENISYFNGDPNNVTLFGESSGGASVHYHVLSPASKGLFHKAIMQSGVAMNNWAKGYPAAVQFVRFMGHDVSNEREALEILTSTPVEDLYRRQVSFLRKLRLQGRPFSPVTEHPNDTAFMIKDVMEVVKSGEYNRVPMIFGYNNREGMLGDLSGRLMGKKPDRQPPGSEEAVLSNFRLKRGSEIAQKVYKKIKEVYFNSEDADDDARVLSSDILIVAGVIRSIKKHLETSQDAIYLYRMSLVGDLNLMKNFGRLQYLKGVCHGDDLGYLFKTLMTPRIERGSLEDIWLRRFVTLWTNFAKYGDPTPDKKQLGVTWPPVEQGQVNYMDIGCELIVRANPDFQKWDLWEELFQSHMIIAKL